MTRVQPQGAVPCPEHRFTPSTASPNFVETVTAKGTYALMFDYGVDGGGVLNNVRALDIHLAAIDAWELSHGHAMRPSGELSDIDMFVTRARERVCAPETCE